MTKKELTKQVSENLGTNNEQALQIVSEFIKVLVQNIDNGETIFLRGLGTFKKQVFEQECSIGMNTGNIERKKMDVVNIHFKTAITLRKKLKK